MVQELRSHLLRIKSSKGLPLKLRVGQNIAMHASPTARDFFSSKFYLPGQFTFIFSKLLLSFSSVCCG